MTKIGAKTTKKQHSRVILAKITIFLAQTMFFRTADLFFTHFNGQVTSHNALPKCLPGQRGGRLHPSKVKCRILMK